MITGTVTDDREIVIQLEALAADQSPVSFRAVVDTGFNGFLTLPIDALNTLGALAPGDRQRTYTVRSYTSITDLETYVS